MSKVTSATVLSKFEARRTALSEQIDEATAHLRSLRAELGEVSVICEALQGTQKPAPKSHKAPKDKQVRRGRPVSNDGIVATAVAEANRRGITEADAGDVLGWFEEIGFETRSGTPNRNSIFVSLNRDSKSGDRGVEKVGRGSFNFALAS